MSIDPLEDISSLMATTEAIVAKHVLPNAESVDRNSTWPAQAMQAFAESGLLGLHVPKNLGGHAQGLSALARITEIISKACPSSAMCFGMHSVGTAVIAAKATKYHRDVYLRKIAQGAHITTLALSENGSGSHLYCPETRLAAEGINYIVNGTKQFVTNGAHADSYVISTVSPSALDDEGIFSCLLVDRNTAGMEWLKPWHGFGMRGNSSRGLILRDVRIPKANLLGEVGDQNWFIFEIIAPYFLMAMSGTYLGIAQAAMDASLAHMKSRRYQSSGKTLSDYESLQTKIASMWIALERTRNLVLSSTVRRRRP